MLLFVETLIPSESPVDEDQSFLKEKTGETGEGRRGPTCECSR